MAILSVFVRLPGTLCIPIMAIKKATAPNHHAIALFEKKALFKSE
jgi:hypothetical protein